MAVLKTSLSLVNANLGRILLAGFSGLPLVLGYVGPFTLTAGGLAFVLQIVVYGRISAAVQGLPVPDAREILRKYALKYLMVWLVLSIPSIVLDQLLKLISLPVLASIVLGRGFEAGFPILFIYVLPILFLKAQGLISIPGGIIYLYYNISKSVVPILLLGLIFLVDILFLFLIPWLIPPPAGYLGFLPMLGVVHLFSLYIYFMVFGMASLGLLKKQSLPLATP